MAGWAAAGSLLLLAGATAGAAPPLAGAGAGSLLPLAGCCRGSLNKSPLYLFLWRRPHKLVIELSRMDSGSRDKKIIQVQSEYVQGTSKHICINVQSTEDASLFLHGGEHIVAAPLSRWAPAFDSPTVIQTVCGQQKAVQLWE